MSNANKLLTRYTVNELADKLGEIKAKIADLARVEDELKAALVESGETEAEGFRFRATISTAEVQNTNWRAVVESLEMTPALKRKITINTKTTDRVTVRVSSW